MNKPRVRYDHDRGDFVAIRGFGQSYESWMDLICAVWEVNAEIAYNSLNKEVKRRFPNE